MTLRDLLAQLDERLVLLVHPRSPYWARRVASLARQLGGGVVEGHGERRRDSPGVAGGADEARPG